MNQHNTSSTRQPPVAGFGPSRHLTTIAPHRGPHTRRCALPPRSGRHPWPAMLWAVVAVVALAASCAKRPTPIGPDARRAADSIVRATHGTDSLALLQRRLEAAGDRLGSVVALREWGKQLRNESRFEEALRTHSEGLRQAEAIGDTLEWVQALNNIGTDYRRMGVLDVAQGYHYRAWVMSEECADTAFTARKNRVVSLNGLGNIYMTLGNYERADSVLRMALNGERRLGSALGQAINYANLGSIFEHRGQTDSAWVYYRRSMALNIEAGSTLGISLCHTYFGSLHERARQYDRATAEYETAYQMMRASRDEWHALNSLVALAGIHIATGRDDKAMDYLGRARQVAEAIKSPEHLAEIHTLYYRHYKASGDCARALAAYEQASALRDSVLDTEKMNRIQNTGLNIERNRQEREMAEARLTLERERTARRTGNAVFVLVVVVLAGALATFLYVQRIHRRNHLALKRLSALRENFFTNITHEFRTPLTVILGLSHDLQSPGAADVAGKAQAIERQGRGLLALINQLLDISKVKSAVGTADWRHGDVTAQLAMVVETYREPARRRHVDLQYLAKEAVAMDFVPDYVNKLMNNLLSNALKFTPDYGRVSVAAWREGGRLRIDVADTGCGMDAETAAHVFEPFYQGRGEAQHVGTGVGLALVRQIVDAVEGSVTVESEVGRGTTFHVALPIRSEVRAAAPEARPVEAAPPLPDTAATPADSEGGDDQCRLLVIEDNRDIAAYIGAQFMGRYAVSYAANGTEGLQKALDLVPDLIVTDLMMPGMDGLEVCRAVRASEVTSHIPIIVVTAKVTEAERISGLEAGADAYLAKPFSADELRTRVEKLLESRLMLQRKFAGMAQGRDGGARTKDGGMDDADLRFLSKVAGVVDRQLHRGGEVDVPGVASAVCMSPRQFYRKVNALTGYAPSAYILRLKISRAKRLLGDNPQMSFGDVAASCGFSDYPNFVRAFRTVCGVTPTEYRRRCEA